MILRRDSIEMVWNYMKGVKFVNEDKFFARLTGEWATTGDQMTESFCGSFKITLAVTVDVDGQWLNRH
jgi:hypothetical protein